MSKCVRDLLDVLSIIAQERLGLSDEEMKEKVIIETQDEEYFEVQDIFLLGNNSGLVIRISNEKLK